MHRMTPQNTNAVSASAMAAHLDMSRANVDELVSDGVVTRERDSKFNSDTVRVVYIRHLKGEASKPAHRKPGAL